MADYFIGMSGVNVPWTIPTPRWPSRRSTGEV